MIADREIDRDVGERIKLLGNEILPRNSLIVRDGRVFVAKFRRRKQVLIEIVVRAKIAKMPVESRAIRSHPGSDAGHHDVPTISGVTGNRERPGGRRLRRQRSGVTETTEQ